MGGDMAFYAYIAGLFLDKLDIVQSLCCNRYAYLHRRTEPSCPFSQQGYQDVLSAIYTIRIWGRCTIALLDETSREISRVFRANDGESHRSGTRVRAR